MASRSRGFSGLLERASLLLLIFWIVFILWAANSINLSIYNCPRSLVMKERAPYLNVYEWTGVDNCLPLSILGIKGHSRFPYAPHKRLTINALSFNLLNQGSGLGRIMFGYFKPPVTGYYRFAIITNDVSELWLSSDEDPRNSKLICAVTGKESGFYNRHGYYKQVKSKSNLTPLENDRKYFVEIIYGHGLSPSHFRLVWLLPGADDYTDIPNYILDGNINNYPTGNMKQHSIMHYHKHSSFSYEKLPIREQNIKFKHQLDTSLPICDMPKKRRYERFTAVRKVHVGKVYPEDGSYTISGKSCIGERRPELCAGNKLIKKERVNKMVKKYMASLVPWNLTLTKVISVKEFDTKDSDHRIYYVDLQVKNLSTFEPMRISEVFWFNKTTKRLCNPREWTYHDDTMVYVIVTTKDQGLWLHRFVDSIEYIQETNKDYSIHPIIVDFGDKYFPINETMGYLEQSKLRQYTVIPKRGRFNKTAAINEAAATIKKDSSIIFQLDLHLDLPVDLFDIVRKHTIPRMSGFTPMLFRLRCGYLANDPYGCWEHHGHGLFAIYREDWVKFGGMNVKEFGTKWGGEDWDLVDRVLAHGIDIQTIRLPGLYHFYHSRSKMWDKTN